MDASNMRFKGGRFDLVLAVGIFEYVNSLPPYLQEINRVWGEGGNLCSLSTTRTGSSKGGQKKTFMGTVGQSMAWGD
ncbi:MAG: class I SAM-dependent methyltransferase [Candidatus Diapherotrites archaeon]|nr:class I SAM-dependent methyltransferase [Candidatus Diapherotrites archaeon]